MKCSTVMAIVCCGALALAVTGCKYDDPNSGDVADTTEIGTDDGNAGNDMNAGKDLDTDSANADETSLAAVTGLPFDQDPNYVRCTDVDFAPVYFGFDASNLQ